MKFLGLIALLGQLVFVAPSGIAAPADGLDGTLSDGHELALTFQGQLPVVHARIDDKAATLLLDLGGAAALALRPDWEDVWPERDVSKVLELNGLAPTPVAARVWKKASLPAGIDGYLGYGFLRRFSLVIDYPKQLIRLSPPGKLATDCGANVVSLLHLGSFAYLRFAHDHHLGLDTGANQNILRNSARDVQGTVQLGEQSINAGAFKKVNLDLPKLDGILGYDFFSRNIVCMDTESAAMAIRER